MAIERSNEQLEVLLRCEATDVSHIAPFGSVATVHPKPEIAGDRLTAEMPGDPFTLIELSHVATVPGCPLQRNPEIVRADD